MRHYDKQHERTDAGYVAVAVAGSLVIFCGMLALAADVGMLYFQMSHMHAAADSAAMAGAFEKFRGNTSSVISAARNDASLNAYTNGLNGVTVTVNDPPLSGNHISDNNFVEVIVARDEPTYFMRVLGTSSVHLSARAVSGPGGGADKCMYILDPSAQQAIYASSSQVTFPCGIMVNSTSSSAVDTSGNGCITATKIYVVGNATSRTNDGCLPTTPPTPIISGVTAEADPLLYLTPPTAAASCDAAHTNYSKNSGTWSISAGTYCGGISVSGGATLNLGAGTYILKGGGLSVTNNNTHLNGTGVFIYNTCNSGSCATSTNGFGTILLGSGANANISAPTSGSYNNMLIWVDRSAPANTTFQVTGGGTFNLTGTLYAKTQPMLFSGGSASSSFNINLVIDKLTLTGGSNLTLLNAFGGGGSAIRQVAMVE